MCWFSKNKEANSEAKVKEKKLTHADEIRKYARDTFIKPARQQKMKRVSFTANEVHQGMHYEDRFPAICSAIDSTKFAEFARVKLVKREGKKQTSTVRWTFEV